MANREIRRSLLERLCRCAGRDWKFEKLFSLLQFRPAASGARQSNTSGGLLRNSEQERTLLSARRNKDAARHFLMSFEGMGKTIRTMEAPIQKADAPAHLSDEFPAGYSLTGCSPALPASASPAGVEHVSSSAQHRGFFTTEHVGKIQTKIVGSGSTLMGLFFCPRDGVHLTIYAVPLQPIRSLHYLLPVIDEVLQLRINQNYFRYLQFH